MSELLYDRTTGQPLDLSLYVRHNF